MSTPRVAKRRSDDAGLILPISRVEKLLRATSSQERLSSTAGIAATAVIEAFIERLLAHAIYAMELDKKKRLTRRHLKMALAADMDGAGAVISPNDIPVGVIAMKDEEESESEGAPVKRRKSKAKRARSPARRSRSPAKKRKSAKRSVARRKAAASPSRSRSRSRSRSASRSRSPVRKAARRQSPKRAVARRAIQLLRGGKKARKYVR